MYVISFRYDFVEIWYGWDHFRLPDNDNGDSLCIMGNWEWPGDVSHPLLPGFCEYRKRSIRKYSFKWHSLMNYNLGSLLTYATNYLVSYGRTRDKGGGEG